jgi:two-component sensor histidine kinase
MLQAKYFFEHGDMDRGRESILAIIKSCDSLGDRKGVGNYWSEMNTYMPIVPQNAAYHLYACRESMQAFTEAGDHHDAVYALRDIAIMHRYVGANDSSEREFLQFLRETAREGITPSANTNYELSALYLNKGDLPRALDYSLKALATLGRKNTSFRRLVYGQLALIYQQTDMPAEELTYGRMAVDECVRFRAGERHYRTTFVIDALVKQGNSDQALAYLQEFTAANPVRSAEEEELIAYDYGLIYDALGAYSKAYFWFRKFTDLDGAAQAESGTSIYRPYELNPFLADLYIGRFYVHWGKYQQARTFLQRALGDTPLNRPPTAVSELELLLYKTDSAAGDLRSAIRHYMRHVSMKDSIFDVKKMGQFQALQVQYQLKEREHSILLLKSESERQSVELNEASIIRKITLGGILLLLILAVWAWYAYRAKRRNVQQLMAQQLVISEKNLSLQQLLGEKNELLTEKNLLLQELHHRVKNNLHTVMSLLESQSAYLSDKAVRNVLVDSQNRIHTISLLHQKLYWSNHVTTLEMAPYVAELSALLANSLGARERRIIITHLVEPIVIDISVGLPIGLLLNEAITNALKHAFPDNTDQNAARAGHIAISMRHLSEGLVMLEIRDDGVGMPDSFGASQHSLGMTLMTSIGQKLGGRFVVENGDPGVSVSLVFRSAEVFS